MTKKHFEALAAMIQQWPYEEVTLFQVADELADVCARFNSTFDRARFLAACGVEG